MSEAYTQWVCKTQPFCLCSDQVDDAECCCKTSGGIGMCFECRAPMRLIDFETGEDAVS